MNKKKGAQLGSRNAAKPRAGLQGNVYLNSDQLDIIDRDLSNNDLDVNRANRLALARWLLNEAIQKLK